MLLHVFPQVVHWVGPHCGAQPHELVQAVAVAGHALPKIVDREGVRLQDGASGYVHLAHCGLAVEACKAK